VVVHPAVRSRCRRVAGVLVVFGLLVVASAYMFLRSRRNPVDQTNVTDAWEPAHDAPEVTADTAETPRSAQV